MPRKMTASGQQSLHQVNRHQQPPPAPPPPPPPPFLDISSVSYSFPFSALPQPPPPPPDPPTPPQASALTPKGELKHQTQTPEAKMQTLSCQELTNWLIFLICRATSNTRGASGVLVGTPARLTRGRPGVRSWLELGVSRVRGVAVLLGYRERAHFRDFSAISGGGGGEKANVNRMAIVEAQRVSEQRQPS